MPPPKSRSRLSSLVTRDINEEKVNYGLQLHDLSPTQAFVDRLVDETLAAEQEIMQELELPSQEHMRMVRGENDMDLQLLMAETGAEICPFAPDLPPFLIISGKRSSVERAKHAIGAKVKQFTKVRELCLPDAEDIVTKEVRVPEELAGLVVGKRGATVKAIAEKTGTITGLPADIVAAELQIQKLVKSNAYSLPPETSRRKNPSGHPEDPNPAASGPPPGFDEPPRSISLEEFGLGNVFEANQLPDFNVSFGRRQELANLRPADNLADAEEPARHDEGQLEAQTEEESEDEDVVARAEAEAGRYLYRKIGEIMREKERISPASSRAGKSQNCSNSATKPPTNVPKANRSAFENSATETDLDSSTYTGYRRSTELDSDDAALPSNLVWNGGRRLTKAKRRKHSKPLNVPSSKADSNNISTIQADNSKGSSKTVVDNAKKPSKPVHDPDVSQHRLKNIIEAFLDAYVPVDARPHFYTVVAFVVAVASCLLLYLLFNLFNGGMSVLKLVLGSEFASLGVIFGMLVMWSICYGVYMALN